MAKVVRMMSQRYNISGPYATDLLLDGYGKGALLIIGRKAEIIDFIERASEGPQVVKPVPEPIQDEDEDGQKETKTKAVAVSENQPDTHLEKEVTGLSPA